MTNDDATMTIAERVNDVERRLVELAVAGTAVMVWRPANDAFAIGKVTLLLALAIGIVGIKLWRVLDRGEVTIPRTVSLVPLVAFLVLGLVSVITSDGTWRSIAGQYGRGTGYALYLGAAIVFLGVLRSVRADTVVRVVRAVLVGGVLVALYGLVQALGADPWTWSTIYGPKAATSTLGNTNFVAGYLGTVFPLGVWAIVATRDRVRWAAIGATVVLGLGVVVARSQQGPIAAAAGLGVFGLVLVVQYGGERRRQLLLAVAGLGLVAALVLGLGVAGSGPLKRLHDTGLDYRREYWSAAVDMTTEHPLKGVGFDRWGSNFRALRGSDAELVALSDISDEPHSVPLNMFASGGFPLGIAYLAFVASIGALLVVGLRRTTGQPRLLLGAVGAAWVGYQVQSAVSIDIPSFPPLHFALAGLVVVLSGTLRWDTFGVPGLLRRVETQTSKKQVQVDEYSRLVGIPAVVVVVLLGLVGLWQLSRPLRADMAVHRARHADGNAATAINSLRSAIHLNPAESEYFSTIGETLAGQPEFAYQYFLKAIHQDPKRFADTLNAARAADVADRQEEARILYETTLQLEPNNLELKGEVGRFFVELGDTRSVELVQAGLRAHPDDIDLQFALAEAYAIDDQPEKRLEVYAKTFETLKATNPLDFARLEALARRYRAFDRYDLAHEALEPVLAAYPDNPGVLYQLAALYQEEGDIEHAIETYDRVATLASPDPEDYPDAAERAEALRSKQEGADGAPTTDETDAATGTEATDPSTTSTTQPGTAP